MIDPLRQFKQKAGEEVCAMAADRLLRQKAIDWLQHSSRYRYAYHCEWLDRSIILLP